MFGIGEVPSPPKEINAKVESCSTISLSWTKAQTNSLPVHKYRVSRRKIGGNKGNVSSKGNHSKIPMGNPEVCNESHDIVDLDENVNNGAVVKSSTIINGEKGFGSCPIQGVDDEEEAVSKSSQWKTVYDGSETECIDSGLQQGKAYVYRIQAWNLVGKSEWAVLDPTELWVEQGCNEETGQESKVTTKVQRSIPSVVGEDKKGEQPRNSFFSSFFQTIFSWGGYIVNAAITLGALSTTLMRVRRATVTSTASTIEPFFPWALRQINKFLENTIGVEFIPQYFTMGHHDALSHHDNAVKSVGLNGYKISPLERYQSERSFGLNDRNIPGELRRAQSEKNIRTNERKNETPEQVRTKSNKDMISNPFSKKRGLKLPPTSQVINKNSYVAAASERSNDSGSDSALQGENQTEVNTRSRNKNKNKTPSMLRKGVRRFKMPKITAVCESTDTNKKEQLSFDHRNISEPGPSLPAKPHSLSFDSIENKSTGAPNVQYLDTECYHLCNFCHKKYKFPKRCRHHCASCGSTFCHKHGKTTHNNLVACKVPGDCICNVCLGKS